MALLHKVCSERRTSTKRGARDSDQLRKNIKSVGRKGGILPLWSTAPRLGDGKDLVYGWDGDLFLYPVGPEDLQFVDFGAGTQAEVNPGIGARGVAAAGEDVDSLADTAGGEEDLGAEGVAGRLAAGHRRRRLCNHFQTEPVIGGLGYIAEEGGRGIEIV